MFKNKCKSKSNSTNTHTYINDGYSNKKGTTYKLKRIYNKNINFISCISVLQKGKCYDRFGKYLFIPSEHLNILK